MKKSLATLGAITALGAGVGGVAVTDAQINPYTTLEDGSKQVVLIGADIKKQHQVLEGEEPIIDRDNELTRWHENDGKESVELRIKTDKPEFSIITRDVTQLQLSYLGVKQSGSRQLLSEKIKYSEGIQDVEIYPYNNGGKTGSKLDVILRQKPTQNTFPFSVNIPFIKSGENLVSVTPSRIEFVVDQPYIYDSGGNDTFGSLKYDKTLKQIIITVPQQFLDDATYPVTIDPISWVNVSGDVPALNKLRVGDSGDTAYLGDADPSPDAWDEFALSTAWDITTLTLTDSTSTPETLFWGNGTSFTLAPDGSALYTAQAVGVAGEQGIYEYSLSTNWDISTYEVPENEFFDETLNNPNGVDFRRSDGLKMYVSAATSNTIKEYDLSPAWDVSSATLVNSTTTSAGIPAIDSQAHISDDGTRVYGQSDGDSEAISVYSLSTPWDITTTDYEDTYWVGNLAVNVGDSSFGIGSNGVNFYVADLGEEVLQYWLETPWDLDTAIGPTYADDATHIDILWNNDGTKFYQVSFSGEVQEFADEYGDDTPWSLISHGIPTAASTTASANARGMTWNDDGTKAYISMQGSAGIDEYTLSSAYDITTLAFSTNMSIDFELANGISFNDDGTILTAVGFTSGAPAADLVEFTLSTPYDLSTASQTASTTLAYTPTDVEWRHDGAYLYILDSTNIAIRQYEASTIFDQSTITEVASTTVDDTFLTGIAFSDTGRYIYHGGITDDIIQMQVLCTPWDVSTTLFGICTGDSHYKIDNGSLRFNNGKSILNGF